LGGIYSEIHPNPPLKKEGTVSPAFKKEGNSHFVIRVYLDFHILVHKSYTVLS